MEVYHQDTAYFLSKRLGAKFLVDTFLHVLVLLGENDLLEFSNGFHDSAKGICGR